MIGRAPYPTRCQVQMLSGVAMACLFTWNSQSFNPSNTERHWGRTFRYISLPDYYYILSSVTNRFLV